MHTVCPIYVFFFGKRKKKSNTKLREGEEKRKHAASVLTLHRLIPNLAQSFHLTKSRCGIT